MENQIIKLRGSNYLSSHISELPSNCLLNKGITGCGGTTVELQSKRNSIILCPTRNLVDCKSELGYFKVDGTVSADKVHKYVESDTPQYKKIIATYDALPKLINLTDYFLLIDEYHLLFNDYTLRISAILYVLNNFRKFKNWCFMTATPLKSEFILNELKDVPQITYEWVDAKKVNINIIDTFFTTREILKLIEGAKDKNLHIFLNSVKTINSIVSKLDLEDYRIVCSSSSKSKVLNYAEITSPVKKVNFYTSCAFEGCDVYDPDGICVIVSDTNIATTVLDITTKVRQVCGRLRDSKYKDQVTIILNTCKHRYAGTTKDQFDMQIKESEKEGANYISLYNKGSEEEKKAAVSVFSFDTYSVKYINKYNNELFLDPNLKSLDIYNYNLISEIYSTSISVLQECSKFAENVTIEKDNRKGLEWVRERIIFGKRYTFEELENEFIPLFKEHKLKWSKQNVLKLYFPEHNKDRRTIDRKRIYLFTFTR